MKARSVDRAFVFEEFNFPHRTFVNMLDIKKIRADFPILNREVSGKPLVYFD